MLLLANKVALVTGAAAGIGKEIARAFAAAGAGVAIADLNADGARETAETMNKLGCSAIGLGLDVTNEHQVVAGVASVVANFGQLDILVSTAGIQTIAALDELPYAEWRRLLSIHLDGAFLSTQAVLRHMYSQGTGGTIIYMGSVYSKYASPLKAPYVTAKHGLIGLAKVVAKEGAAHGVRANVICPGFVRTPSLDKQIPKQARQLGISVEKVLKEAVLRETVDGEFTTVEEIARTALFLASFPTNALTGQSLIVSHGWCMQ